MKIFFKIFLFYFFSLILLPCNEAAACVTSGGIDTEIAHNDKAAHDEEDTCPPLCNCSCCEYYVVKAVDMMMQAKASVHSLLTHHHSTPLASMYYPIWQPPRL